MDAESFASMLLTELRKLDPRAEVLEKRPGRSRSVVLGIDDEGFEPLLRLSEGSASCNVMSLFVRHHRRWEPTFQRGTPDQLAKLLAGPFQYLWAMHAAMVGFRFDPNTPHESGT